MRPSANSSKLSLSLRAVLRAGAVAMALLSPWLGGGSVLAAPSGMPQLLPWGQESFAIPFFVPPATDRQHEPVEVRLLVSSDQGATWQVEQRAAPTAKQFVYRASRDGEYWFTIRTVDRSGAQLPDEPYKPSLRVLVDTLKPRLEVSANSSGDGALRVRWQAVDPGLKRSSLNIEYRAGDGRWYAVDLDPTDDTYTRSTSVGELTLWAKQPLGPEVELRAEIADFAGNRTQVTTRATPASFPPPAVKPNGSDLSASDPPPVGPASGSTAMGPALEGPALNPPQYSASAAANTGLSKPWPVDAKGERPGVASSRGEWQSVVKPLRGLESRSSDSSSNQFAGDDLTPPPAQSQVFPRVANRAQDPGPRLEDMLPPGERARMINSRSFDLEYEISAVGPTGVGKVELWQTEDGGKSWRSAGIDEDKKSPFRVRTAGEGLYGYRIIVQSGSGLSVRPPRSGDLPELWIGVDLTKPTGQITRTVAGEGDQQGTITIFYEAQDRQLALRPISLYYSTRSVGPWTPIATGLDNTGRYKWAIDRQVPEQVFLRMEMRDEASNVGIYLSEGPVSLERTRPEGRLRAVRAAEANDSQEPPPSASFAPSLDRSASNSGPQLDLPPLADSEPAERSEPQPVNSQSRPSMRSVVVNPPTTARAAGPASVETPPTGETQSTGGQSKDYFFFR